MQNPENHITKFSRQAADLGVVFIYKEGLFARAYNEGAYGFIHHLMACKPVRRHVKAIAGDRVVCGAPLTTLMKLPAFLQAEQIDALIWRWPLSKPVDLAQYNAWRESLPLIRPGVSTPVELPALPQTDFAQQLIGRLMQFNVAASTPVAAINLVADLQRQWQDNMGVALLEPNI